MKKWSTIIVLLICLFFIYTYFENNIIELTKIEIVDKNIPEEFNNFKIAHISDLHNKDFKDKLINLIDKNNPDVIFITGDIIDNSDDDINICLNLIKNQSKKRKIYYVNGNHESASTNYNDLKLSLINEGVEVLENRKVSIEKDSNIIDIIGVKDPTFDENYFTEKDENIMRGQIKDLKGDNYTILLSHRPELFDIYEEESINLIFSGHAHGGQFRLPFSLGLVAPDQGFFPKYSSGKYEDKDTTMIVSRGLGNSVVPWRINNNPELVFVTLKNK